MKKLPLPVFLILVLVCMAAACDGTFVNYLLGPYDRGGSGGSVLPPGNPRARYVAPTARGSGDGSSWANASGDLQKMIDDAEVDATIDEIWVKKGTYTPTRRKDGSSSSPTDYENIFTLKEGVKIYGGFEGGEVVLAQRNWKKNETTLSGDFYGDDSSPLGYQNSTLDENADRVVWSEGLTSATVLDGFKISGGNAAVTGSNGGGIYNNHSSPTLANLVITGNTANKGGGIYNNNSSPKLTNVTISGNLVEQAGGGIYNDNSSPTLTNVIITGNASEDGGGILNDNSSPTLTNVTISGNYTRGAGGAMYNQNSSPIIQNSIIWGNTATFSPNVHNANGGSPAYWNSLVAGVVAIGNIDADPHFVLHVLAASYSPTLAGDYRLKVSPILSPAIDAGDNSFVAGVPTDLDGNPRIKGVRVDMGAYEIQ